NILPSTSSNNTMKSSTQSMLDADFDDDNNNLDKLEYYIAEKQVNKKVNMFN
ncbi:10922_t:CDS:1, partial [Gigaspora margarita]